jgi:uncharacterized protein YecE (DUF72 family)
VAHDVRIGCSGWNYPHWRGTFYEKGLPERRWLERYAEHFDTVEVNATFYRLPTRKAVQAWAEATPPGFAFALKASRYLTHIKRLRELPDGIARLYERIEPVVERGCLGCILWQLPETFHRDDERLAGALEALPDGRHAFEFRHPSWFCDEVYALLRRAEAALVIGDDPRRPFQTEELTAPFTFVRFHHGHRGRRGNYSKAELEDWARKIRRWRRDVDVYAYFNNDWETFAPRNAEALKTLLG